MRRQSGLRRCIGTVLGKVGSASEKRMQEFD
jgi:hypothetical protein